MRRSTPPASTPPVPASPPPATTRYWTFVRVPSCTVSEPGPGQLSTTSSPTSSRCAPSHVTVAPGGVPAFAKATGAPASRWQRLMPAPRGQRHGRGGHATRAHIRCPRPVVPARSCPPLISQHLLHQFQMSGMATLTRPCCYCHGGDDRQTIDGLDAIGRRFRTHPHHSASRTRRRSVATGGQSHGSRSRTGSMVAPT